MLAANGLQPMSFEYANGEHWSLDDIALDDVDVERGRPREERFLLLAGASFVESASDLYTRNLVDQFRGDAEVSSWLVRDWEPQELQHGHALRAYVNRVWPALDRQGACAAFFAEHSRCCTVEELEPTPGLELAARCVVEMGTSTYYAAIGAICEEPVLGDLVGAIQRDEVSHYKHFYHFFNKY